MFSMSPYNVITIFEKIHLLMPTTQIGYVLAQLEHLERQEDLSISTQAAYKIKQEKIAIYLDQNEAVWKIVNL